MTGCVALILAGGSGSRLGGESPKQYLPLAGRPVLHHAVKAFVEHPAVGSVQVVIRAGDAALYRRATGGLQLPGPVDGGATRQQSARAGLERLASDAPRHVLIHDAARPFPGRELIDRVIGALQRTSGAVPALPVGDTLKTGAGDPPMVVGTVPREHLWRAQTPQGFLFDGILGAHRTVASDGLTDDADVAVRAGVPTALVAGSADNIKITTLEDLARAERIAAGGPMHTRVGHGFDVHPLGAGDHVTLAGLRIPHDGGLHGHSDADVALHALTDAILGALADGDIGSHFPDSDPRWRGAPSRLFLARAAEIVGERAGRIVHVDVTVVCEAPRIAPHRDAMRSSIAGILSIDVARVSVKATTTEKLGFLGRGEAIAAHAVASVALREPA